LQEKQEGNLYLKFSSTLRVRRDRFRIEAEIQNCSRCRLSMLCKSKAVGNGNCQNPEFFFIGTAPSSKADPEKRKRDGKCYPLRTFDFRVAAKFRSLLKEAGLYDQSYLTNISKCGTPGNRDPKPKELKACLVWLEQEFQLYQPFVVVAVGSIARSWLERISTEQRGNRRELFGSSRIVLHVYHPNYCFSYDGITRAKYLQQLRKIKRALP